MGLFNRKKKKDEVPDVMAGMLMSALMSGGLPGMGHGPGMRRPDPELPKPADQLFAIKEVVKGIQDYNQPFKPGDIITQREDAHEYKFPKPGDVAVVVEVDIPRQLPEEGGPVRRRDIIIATMCGPKVLEYLVDSRYFEKLEVGEKKDGE